MSLNDPMMPAYPTSMPRTLSYRPLRGLAVASTVLIVLTCVVSAVECLVFWDGYQLAEDYLAGTGVTYDDLVDADDRTLAAEGSLIMVMLASAVVFLVWLWRARTNAELVRPQAHGLGRGWTIGGWFCPVVNFWFPFRIVHDIWRASRPAGVVEDHWPVRWWWAAWILTYLASTWMRVEARSAETGLDAVRDVALADTATTVFTGLAGVFLIIVIRRVTAWQSAPPQG